MTMYSLNRSRGLLGFFFLLFYASFSISQSVTPINGNKLDSLIANRNGNILLLNIWATWCEPCKEEFPALIKLASDYKKKNVRIVTISVDDPDDVNEKIIPFLHSLNVPFSTYVADFPSQDSLINKFDPEWTGAVPATFIFDRKGNRQKFLIGKQTYHQFKNAVDDLLQ
jgi:thiol-disulfide isomerase/thioredoxin